jgi:hypothetical protein
MNKNAESIDFSSLTEGPQALRKLLMAQVRARGGTPTMDAKAVVQSLVKQTLEAFLELGLAALGENANIREPLKCVAIL